MFQVRDLSVSYGAVRALDHVSLDVPDGAITAVLGANGAGKTTLLRSISRLVKWRSGTLRFEDRDISRCTTEELARMGVAHVPEDRGVVEELTVEENLRLGALAGSRRDLTPVYELFPALLHRRRHLASTLSGGERQMLSIGRALASTPRVLLLDEPSLGLAPLVVRRIMEVLRGLADDDGLAILLVEQNARTALSVADEALVLALGKVVVRDRAEVVARDEGLRHAYLGF